jgi:hypothetical protein
VLTYVGQLGILKEKDYLGVSHLGSLMTSSKACSGKCAM